MDRTPSSVFEIPEGLPDWERMQCKTFGKWCNLYLNKRGLSLVNFDEDLVTGVKLINLVEVISDAPLGKYNKNPRTKIQNIENLQLPINFINSFLKEVHLRVSYSVENVLEKNFKLIMGMIFCLIHKFEINDSGLDGKDGLLLWCQKNTKGYKDVDVTDFSRSWGDGLAFNALIHKFRPDLIDYDSLSKGNALLNLQTAFAAADKLGIPRLLDPEDIAEAAKPDDKAIMTQLAHYWKILSKLAKAGVGKERVSAVLGRFKQNRDMATDYSERAKKLQDWILEHQKEFSNLEFGETVPEVQAKLEHLNNYHEDEKPEKMKEKLATAALLRQLQAKQRVEKAPLFSPPEEISPEATEKAWNELLTLEAAYTDAASKALALARAREKEMLRLKARIEKMDEWIKGKREHYETAGLGDSRWETEGLMRMDDAVKDEFKPFRARAKDIAENAPKFKELEELAAGTAKGMEELEKMATDRNSALVEQLSKHMQFEQKQLEVGALGGRIVAALDDLAEGLNAPIKVWTKHDVELVEGDLKTAEAALEAQKDPLAKLTELSAEVADKPNPFERVPADQVQAKYDALGTELKAKRDELAAQLDGLHKLDALKEEFGAKAEDLDSFIGTALTDLEGVNPGDDGLEAALEEVNSKKAAATTSSEEKLGAIREVKNRMTEAGETPGEANSFTHLTLPGLVSKEEAMRIAFDDKAGVINGRLVAKKGMEISPEQMEELQHSFKFFDKQGRNGLDMEEFRQCQESLGQELEGDQLSETFTKLDKGGKGFIVFDEFVEYMQTVMRVTDSYDDILEALQGISGDTIAPAALGEMLAPEVAEYVLSVAPKGEDGNVDVKELLAMVFDVTK